jgi:hypothetical protein
MDSIAWFEINDTIRHALLALLHPPPALTFSEEVNVQHGWCSGLVDS